MKRTSIVGLCLVAAFALSAIAAAAAQAETKPPVYQQCSKAEKVGKQYVGHYTNKECTAGVETGGKYELEELTKALPFKDESKGAKLDVYIPKGYPLEPLEGGEVVETVECEKSKSEGDLEPKGKDKVTITFEKCETEAEPKVQCTGTKAGEKAGNITTFELDSKLVWITQPPAPNKVGTLISGLGPKGALAEFVCPPYTVTVLGTVIGENELNLNAALKKFDVNFTVTNNPGHVGGQTITMGYEPETMDYLTTEIVKGVEKGSLPAGLTFKDEISTKDPIRILEEL